MKEVYGTFIESIERTKSVVSFRFTLDQKITFLPGQFMLLLFDETNKNNMNLNKYLSLSTSPDHDFIEVTKRISESDFSRKLVSLNKGDRVLFKAPMGNCVYKDEYNKIAFLIGGIGITPVISILEYIESRKLDTDVCLLYSNRFPDDVAFKDELDRFATRPNVTIIYTITDCDPQDNICMKGFITKEMVVKTIPDWKERYIFVYGSPTMVDSMKSICTDLTCDSGRLKTENFMGY
jgi:ferredoxin-NADP reductase